MILMNNGPMQMCVLSVRRIRYTSKI